jgi:hypothetical protein
VTVDLSVDVDRQGSAERPGVEVRTAPAQVHHLALADGHAVDLGVDAGPPGAAGGDRALEPHQLLDGRGEQRRLGDDAASLVGVAREPPHDARQRRRDRVEPGDREQVHDVDDLVVGQAVALELERHEAADEVVARHGLEPPLGQAGLQVRAQPVAGLDPDRLVLLERAALVLEDAVLHGDEEVEVLERHAEQAEERDAGKRDRERVVKLDPAVPDEAVDQLVGQLADLELQRGDPSRRQERVQQLPVAAVELSVDVQRDERVA